MLNRDFQRNLRIISGLTKDQFYDAIIDKDYPRDTEFANIWKRIEENGILPELKNLTKISFEKLMTYCDNYSSTNKFRISDVVQFDPLFDGFGGCFGIVKSIDKENESLIVTVKTFSNMYRKQEIIDIEVGADEVKFCGIASWV